MKISLRCDLDHEVEVGTGTVTRQQTTSYMFVGRFGGVGRDAALTGRRQRLKIRVNSDLEPCRQLSWIHYTGN